MKGNVDSLWKYLFSLIMFMTIVVMQKDTNADNKWA